MRRFAWSPFYSILLVVALVVGISLWVEGARAEQARRAGYQVIRPPHEVHAFAIQGIPCGRAGRMGWWASAWQPGKCTRPSPVTRNWISHRALLAMPDGSLWIGHMTG
jgi:hypothetical protein